MIVPTSLRKEMLSQIHSNHLGIETCKRRARDVLFWPGMSDQITDIVSKCNTCIMYRNSQAREPLKSHELPERPWQKIAIDLFELERQNYVVIVDCYWKFFELSHLPNSKSKTVVNHIKPHLASYGIYLRSSSVATVPNLTALSLKSLQNITDLNTSHHRREIHRATVLQKELFKQPRTF